MAQASDACAIEQVKFESYGKRVVSRRVQAVEKSKAGYEQLSLPQLQEELQKLQDAVKIKADRALQLVQKSIDRGDRCARNSK